MGFRGSRVQIPPSRLIEDQALRRLLLWGFFFVAPRAVSNAVSFYRLTIRFVWCNTTFLIISASACWYDVTSTSSVFKRPGDAVRDVAFVDVGPQLKREPLDGGAQALPPCLFARSRCRAIIVRRRPTWNGANPSVAASTAERSFTMPATPKNVVLVHGGFVDGSGWGGGLPIPAQRRPHGEYRPESDHLPRRRCPSDPARHCRAERSRNTRWPLVRRGRDY